MTKLHPGEDIYVQFKGLEHRAEVIDHRSGYVMCRIQIDPTWDYGKTDWVDPEPTVCVKESHVRHAETKSPK